MPNPMMMPGGMFGMVAGAPRKKPEEEKRQSYWQGGDKFTLRDGIAGALAAVGDGLNNWANGGGGGATNMLVGGRINAMEQAKQARAQAEAAAQRQADLAAVGIDPARGRLLGDSVGGVVAGQMKPQERAMYDEYNPVTVGTWQGPVKVPRGGPPAPPSVGAVENGFRFKGGNPADKNNWEPINGGQQPIPQLQMNPQAQVYLDEAMKQEMLAGARRDGRDYMQRMGY